MDKINLLVSHTFIKSSQDMQRLWLPLSSAVRLMIDSGAHTNFVNMIHRLKGKKTSTPDVELGEYIEACKRYHGHAWQYVMLDVARSPQKTDYNLNAMLDSGLVPMPVLVEIFPPERAFDNVERLVAINPHIGVAGAIGAPPDYCHYRYQTAYKLSGGKAKIHGFAYARWPWLFQIPIHSADASTFVTGFSFGYVFAYSRTRGLMDVRWPKLTMWRSNSEINYIVEYLLRCGVRYEELTDVASYRGSYNIPTATAIAAYLNFMRHAAEHGVFLFLAVSTGDWLRRIAAVMHTLDKRAFDYHSSRARYTELCQLQKHNWHVFERELLLDLQRGVADEGQHAC